DKVRLSFGQPTRRAQSVAIAPDAMPSKTMGTPILGARDAPIPGITGNEVLRIDLGRYNIADSVTADLSQTPQPPTLDSIADAINAAIMTVPLLDANGDPVLDGSGNPRSRWQSRFAVEKTGEKWGLVLKTSGAEKLAIDQVGAKDALMVVSGQTAIDAPGAAQILRFDDPAGSFGRKTLGSIAAIDREATERAKLVAPTAPASKDAPKPAVPMVPAATNARAIATDIQGFSYVVGTTAGDLGANRSDGGNDLFLSKLDSEGKIVWQRTLGVAGEADGAAVSISANGDIVVAGTVKGPFNGAPGTDSDMLVARFDGAGDEKFATSVRGLGNDSASAVTVGVDGSIYVAGKSSSNGGDAFLARLGADGKLAERRTIDSGGNDGITALAIDGTGALLALSKESGVARLRRIDAQAIASDLGTITLGTADARAIAVSATGDIAVAGATYAALAGAQVNGASGGRDGFVTRIDAALSGASTSYLGTSGDDQVDSVAFLGDAVYAGGRTTGALDGAQHGAVDGFVSRIDSATGAIESISQFGQVALRTEPVRIAAAQGGAGIMGALGLRRGLVNSADSTRLVAQTSVRAGDELAFAWKAGPSRRS
ncbi:MAG: SBBP repeat-containing protein, partial [Sphingomonadaceae bacterium]